MSDFWDKNTLIAGLEKLPDKIDMRTRAIFAKAASDMTAYARRNAPWTDRTGNARNGLHASSFHAGPVYTVVLAHSMSYGVWLEIRWSGKYAIIMPTIQYEANKITVMLRGMLGSL